MGSLKVYDGTQWQTIAAQGATGPSGLPAGGLTNAILAKQSGSDFDVAWTTAPIVSSISLASPSAGWSVTAGYTVDKSFNPASTTLNEVANVLATLIDTLKTAGLLKP